MRANPPEGAVADTSGHVDAQELAQLCQLSVEDLRELVDYGALQPLPGSETGRQVFSTACIPALLQGARLRRDFDCDLFTVALLLDGFHRVARLEAEVRSLRARLPQDLRPLREGPACWRELHG